MLNKFNTLIKSMISEGDEGRKTIFKTNEFFIRYINPVAEECDVLATKQREDTFLIFGPLKNLKQFFTKFKVDKNFMDNPSEFKIYSPMFTYGDISHNLKLDECYPVFDDVTPLHTHAVDNSVKNVIHGRWFAFIGDRLDEKLKEVKPSEISKYFRNLYPKADKDFNEDVHLYIEFQVNCEDWKNLIWDEMSEYAKEPDEMNEAHNEDPDDFDYSLLDIKKENDEDIVKRALKDVERTEKSYK